MPACIPGLPNLKSAKQQTAPAEPSLQAYKDTLGPSVVANAYNRRDFAAAGTCSALDTLQDSRGVSGRVNGRGVPAVGNLLSSRPHDAPRTGQEGQQARAVAIPDEHGRVRNV